MSIFRALVYYESTKFNDMHVNWINCIDQGLFHYINKVTVANLIKSLIHISDFYFLLSLSFLSSQYCIEFSKFGGFRFLINHPFKIFLLKLNLLSVKLLKQELKRRKKRQ